VRDLLQVFKALSDQTRLRILSLLSRRELCVCELAEALGMEQSRVSHQLHILKNARLVDDRREGRWIVYSLDSEDGRSYNPQIFELVSVVLARDETVRDDGRRLKDCLRRGVRERCHPAAGEHRNTQRLRAEHL